MIQIGGRTYELIQNYKNAWDPEAFKQRYSEVWTVTITLSGIGGTRSSA
ncbi:hypothetical protein HMSSN036_43570 [Paenibacillus macerans]|nr:hypothetical protein HMSSN036_43570 [Paenibacillus macerans]